MLDRHRKSPRASRRAAAGFASGPAPAALLLALAPLLGSCLEDVTGQQPPTQAVQCRLAGDCPVQTAICDPAAYTCRACRGAEDDARCRDRDPKTPVCAQGGVCGVCAGSGESEACAALDPKQPTCAMGKCQACDKAADCLSGVCQEGGSCAKVTDVLFVDNKGGTCNPGVAHAGTPQDPLCEVQAGVDKARADRKPIVRVAGSKVPYAPVTVTATSLADLVISGVPTGTDPAFIRGDQPALSVLGAATRVVVTAQGLDLGSTGADAVVCDQRNGTVMPELTLRGSRLFEAKRAGLQATKCKLVVDGVRAFNNNNGGLRLSGSAYDVQNVMVYGNSRAPGVTIDAPAEGSRLRFATIAYNVYIGAASGVDCGGQPVEIQHSIVAGNLGAASQFRGCQLTGVVTGTETVAGGIAKSPEYVKADDPLDLHLKDGAASRDCCVDKVPAAAGLPTRDIDGARRPRGAALDIGAHEL